MSGSADLTFETLTSVGARLATGELSPVELLEAQIAAIDARDPDLHAYMTVTAEPAREAARRAEREIAEGKHLGPLHGVPVAVKDLCFTRGVKTTCGSLLYEEMVPDHDAHVVSRLAEAGAILVGKLAMTEFAMTGYPPHYRCFSASPTVPGEGAALLRP